MAREIEPICGSFCRHGSCTFTAGGTVGAFWASVSLKGTCKELANAARMSGRVG